MLQALIYGVLLVLGFYLMIDIMCIISIIVYAVIEKLRKKTPFRSTFSYSLAVFTKVLLLSEAICFIPMTLMLSFNYLELYAATLIILATFVIVSIFVFKRLNKKTK